MYDDELTWEEAEELWQGLALAEQARGDDELRRAFEAGYGAALEAHGITTTEARR